MVRATYRSVLPPKQVLVCLLGWSVPDQRLSDESIKAREGGLKIDLDHRRARSRASVAIRSARRLLADPRMREALAIAMTLAVALLTRRFGPITMPRSR